MNCKGRQNMRFDSQASTRLSTRQAESLRHTAPTCFRWVRSDERPQVSDEPCATEFGNHRATQRSYGRIEVKPPGFSSGRGGIG